VSMRHAGAHARSGNDHAGARHAASRRGRGTKTPTASRALSAPHLNDSAVKSRAQTREPGAFLLSPSASAWQTIMRAAQTQAFGVALLIALATSSLVATVAPRGAQTQTTLTPPSPPAGVTSAPQNSPAAQPERRPTAPVIAHAAVPRSEQPDRVDRLPIPPHHSESPFSPPNLDAPTDSSDLDAALNELDRQADRDQAWASQNPGTAPIPEPWCPANFGETKPSASGNDR
jgi:hypothetical protein